MRKVLTILLLVAVMSALCLGFTACNNNDIKLNSEYKHVYYSSTEGKFISTGNSVVVSDDYTYLEKYAAKDGGFHELKGNYVDDKNLSLYYMKAGSSSLSSFKKSYKTELKNMGYSTDYINMVLSLISESTEMYRYNGYMFKVTSVTAARSGKDVNKLDGLYNFVGELDNGSDRIKFERGSIYLEEVDEFGDFKYDKKIGTYEVNGDFITIAPSVALDGGAVSSPVRYLMAEIELPTAYKDDVNSDGEYNKNDVITYYEKTKIKVFVKDFYTIKNVG